MRSRKILSAMFAAASVIAMSTSGCVREAAVQAEGAQQAEAQKPRLTNPTEIIDAIAQATRPISEAAGFTEAIDIEYAVDVDAAGQATGCSAITGRGNAAVDEGICAILTQQARYTPASDAAGNAVADVYTQMLRIKPGTPGPPANGEFKTVAVVLDRDQNVQSCEWVGGDAPDFPPDMFCNKGWKGQRMDDGSLVTGRITLKLPANMVDMIASDPDRFLPKPGYAIDMAVDENGRIASCNWLDDDHPDMPAMPICEQSLKPGASPGHTTIQLSQDDLDKLAPMIERDREAGGQGE